MVKVDKSVPLYIVFLWFAIAVISTFSGSLMFLQQQKTLTFYKIFDLSFYFFIPAFIWILITPLIISLIRKYPLEQNLLKHLIISILFSPILRIIALIIDFSIKHFVGMMEDSVWSVMKEINWMIWASSPEEIMNYWLIVGIVYLVHFIKKEQKTEIVKEKQDYLVTTHNGRKILLKHQDIYAFESAGNYIKVRTFDKTYQTRSTLKNMIKEIDTNKFRQIHRSAVIQIEAIQSLQHWRRGEYLIVLKNGRNLTSSRTYRQNIEWILQSVASQKI